MVANPERGEVNITVGGRVLTLKMSMNAAVALEKRMGKPIGQVLADAGSMHFEAIRTMVWLLLQKYHAVDFPTEEPVGDLIDDAGGVGTFFTALIALGQEQEPKREGASENPPAAQGGTGDDSTSNAAGSV